jgi:S1-C subfamily serine protease
MRRIALGALVAAFFLGAAADAWAQDRVRDLVAKIHTVRRAPDLLRPWTTLAPQRIFGSGVVIEGRRILTNAHVVQYASQIYVQPYQSPEKLPARVVGIAPEMDLAVLELEEEDGFFAHRGWLDMAEDLPAVKDPVVVYGYPTGGAELSVTQGIVSRVEFVEYHFGVRGLRIQVDAPLNPGNSGGPAVSDGRLVGLVFSNVPSAQSIGYLIPVEEIRLFLRDIADGEYNGKPRILDAVRPIENPTLREKLKLAKGVGGLLVEEPYDKDGLYPLKPLDVITHIAGTPVDSDGKVTVRHDLRLSALYLLQRFTRDGKVRLGVHRAGAALEFDMRVATQRELVVPFLMNADPRYFIYGPLVFTQATQEYIERLGGQREQFLANHGSPLMVRRYDRPAFAGEELVVVCGPMFPHRITRGYDDPDASVVTEVNGIAVRNLQHMVDILRDSDAPHVAFRLVRRRDRGPQTIIFDRQEIRSTTEEILNDNGIRYLYSRDIRPVWERRTSASE